MEPVMDIQHIYKIYNRGQNEVRALDDVSMCVRRGEFVSIVGSSGSGKSTLMNILGCLDLPDSGRYLLLGRDVSRLRERETAQLRSRQIGFVFQSFHLIATLSALENVELPLLYTGVPPKERRRRAMEAHERVGLSGRASHKPFELSGGQQQRVAIARAIVTQPAILLADEPTGNLDSHVGAQVMALLKELNDDGKTIVLITHDALVARAAQRTLTVKDGRLINL